MTRHYETRQSLCTRCIFAAIFFVALSGCATAPQIADEAINANLAVEDAQNRVHLLNVVRAAYRRPMHFTSLSQVGGTISSTRPGIELSGNIGADVLQDIAALKFSFQPTRPNFTISVWDTAKFQRGITKSADPSVLKFYLDQGWPRELVMALFVREIEIVTTVGDPDKDPIIQRKFIRNYPDHLTDFREFMSELEALSACGFEVLSKPVGRPVGPALSMPAAQSLEHLISAAKEKLAVTHKKGDENSWSVNRLVVEHHFRLGAALEAAADENRDELKARCKQSKILAKQAEEVKSIESERAKAAATGLRNRITAVISRAAKDLWDKQARSPENTGAPVKVEVEFELRSPISMLYYLGELSRAQLKQGDGRDYEIRIGSSNLREPIFKIERSPDVPAASALSVHYMGNHYSVPAHGKLEGDRGAHGRSMQALTLVSQLINMQKEGDDLPSVSTIKLVGP